MYKKIVGILICMLFFLVTIPQTKSIESAKTDFSDIIVLNPIADTHLNHRQPDTNFGSDIQLEARNEYGSGGSSGWAWDSLINFDISGIDSGSIVLSANLKLYYWSSLYNPQGRSIRLYRATSTWDEYSTTWNNQPSYDSQISSSTNVPSSYSWMSWDVSDDVQDFINGTKTNFGWKLTDEGYWGSSSIPETVWRSREYSESSYRPYLEVEIQSNNPPNIPSSPNPSNHATGIDVNSDISWSCSDPDPGDTLTYDVYFGTNSNPPLVSTDQMGQTYKPATMSYSTKYYWKIVAKDNHGNYTSGPIWDFTTTDEPNEPPTTPSRPAGSPGGWAGFLIEFSTSTTDPDNHQIRYGWDWNGDDTIDEWSELYPSGNTCIKRHKWNNPGIYNIKVKAKDSKGAVSGWSDVKIIQILVKNELPYTPSDPDPSNHATEVNINSILYWKGGDPDICDTITYDIYFGTSSPPPKVFNNQTVTIYNSGTMNVNTKYYWKIIAWDNHGASSTSPIWDFTTSSINQPPIVDIISPKENDSISGFVNISGAASDPDGDETRIIVEVRIDDKLWQNTSGTEYWFCIWNTEEESNGVHTIYARSFDGEIYSDISIVNVTVINAFPKISISGITGGLGISVNISNIGTGIADSINWSIIVEKNIGLILSGSHTENMIDELAAGGSETINSSGLRGIGWITITVEVADVVKQATGFLLGPLVLRVTEL